jgi:hypothetical protein
MTPAEREQVRARLLGAAAGEREVAPAPGGLRPVWAGIAAAVLLLGAATVWMTRPDERSPRVPALSDPAAAPVVEPLVPRHSLAPSPDVLRPRNPLPEAAPSSDLPARRTIYFTAPRGTRLVWVVPENRPGAG